jgi:lipopolysaccharide/colanic/teichoic acid biosynthesis glycosyltransferase
MAKRTFDIVIAALGLAALAPLLIAIGTLVYLADGGSPIFRQERVGRGGKHFRLLKFRTMTPMVRTERMTGTDDRISAVGQWLRRSKLDELPQLLNVLAGHMSLVGPRPELPHYVALYSSEQLRVLQFRPGLTDPASLAWADEGQVLARSPDPERTYTQQVMPAKLACAIAYATRASFLSDLAVIGATLALVGRRLWPSRAKPVIGLDRP